MEFSVFRQVLIRALGHMQSIVERRATLPILMNVKIEVKDNLVLSATNVDLELVEHVVADITLGGKVTVPVHMLYDIVRKLPDDAEIKFKQTGDQLVVSSGRAIFKLPTLPAENFPMMAGAHLTTKFTMTTGDLAHLVNQTKFAIPTDDVRYHLGGIYFHITDEGKNKMLTAVATDSQRLALCSASAPDGSVDMPSVILPRRVIGELSKLLEDANVDDVTIELSDTKARFTVGPATLTSKLVDAQYPNYRVVIPKGNDKIAVLNRKQFISAVDLVSVASVDKAKTVQLTFSMNKLVVNASSADNGTATQELDIEYNGDDTFTIAFNVKFLLDIAGQVEGDKMQLAMQDPLSPTVWQSTNKKTDCLFILMPMRI
ncbi:MAG: DNA polymerase III subunit beta [Alphaproteobacteria bacterium]|nr:DNA polymerase III subunit beta [Alphaproteobacteria bacterium]MCL2890103.1 DNA polymerase III subunit beta [Alphaproteobacteria bacterium]